MYTQVPTVVSSDYITTEKDNKDQSNLVKSGIASRFYSPGRSSNLQLHGLAEG